MHAARRPQGLAAKRSHQLSLRSKPLAILASGLFVLLLLHAARRPQGLAAKRSHQLSLRSKPPLDVFPLVILLLLLHPLRHASRPQRESPAAMLRPKLRRSGSVSTAVLDYSPI